MGDLSIFAERTQRWSDAVYNLLRDRFWPGSGNKPPVVLWVSVRDYSSAILKFTHELNWADDRGYEQIGAISLDGILDQVDRLEWQALTGEVTDVGRGEQTGGITALADLFRDARSCIVDAVRAAARNLWRDSRPNIPIVFKFMEERSFLSAPGQNDGAASFMMTEVRTFEPWQKPSTMPVAVSSSRWKLRFHYPHGEQVCLAPERSAPRYVLMIDSEFVKIEVRVSPKAHLWYLLIEGQAVPHDVARDVNYYQPPSISRMFMTTRREDLVRLLSDFSSEVPVFVPKEPDDAEPQRRTPEEVAAVTDAIVAHVQREIAQVDFDDSVGGIYLSEEYSEWCIHLYRPISVRGPLPEPLSKHVIGSEFYASVKHKADRRDVQKAVLERIVALPVCDGLAAGLVRLVIMPMDVVATVFHPRRPWVPYRNPFAARDSYHEFLLNESPITDRDVAAVRDSSSKREHVQSYARLLVKKAMSLAELVTGCPAEAFVQSEQMLEALRRELPGADETKRRTLFRRAERVALTVCYPPLQRFLLVDMVMGGGVAVIREQAWNLAQRVHQHHEKSIRRWNLFDIMPEWLHFATRVLRDEDADELSLSVITTMCHWPTGPNFHLDGYMHHPRATGELISTIIDRCGVAGRKETHQIWADGLVGLVAKLISHPAALGRWLQEWKPVLAEWEADDGFVDGFRAACKNRGSQ